VIVEVIYTQLSDIHTFEPVDKCQLLSVSFVYGGLF